MNDELEAVREATADYRGDLDPARADGWFVDGPFVPEMGHHYINPGNIATDPTGLSITDPAVLVYDDPEDDQDLLAVEHWSTGGGFRGVR